MADLVRSAGIACAETSSSGLSTSERASFAEIATSVLLVNELQVAVAEAGRDGFYPMVRLLDDCSGEIALQIERGRPDKRALIERGRHSLDMWRALRDW